MKTTVTNLAVIAEVFGLAALLLSGQDADGLLLEPANSSDHAVAERALPRQATLEMKCECFAQTLEEAEPAP